MLKLEQNIFADSYYTVKKGDTLYSISRKYQITISELRAANNFSEKDILKEGVKIIIPSADITNAASLSSNNRANTSSSSTKNSIYTIVSGDTLYGIARKFNIRLSELLAANNINQGTTIKAGQKIKIPTSAQSIKRTENHQHPNNEKIVLPHDIIWPLSSPSIKSISGKVSGVLLTGKDHESVISVHSGTVMYTGVYRGFGEIVFIQSKTGLIYSYSGLGSVKAKKGDYIVAGDEIGRTGAGSEASIKFMVFQNGMPVDPVKAPRG